MVEDFACCVVDGYEFRPFLTRDEYLENIRLCRMMGSPDASLFDGDGVLHFGIFKDGKLAACLDLHSVFELFYPWLITPESQLEHALIRIALLGWLKKHGLLECYGAYFPGDYEYLAQEGDERMEEGNKELYFCYNHKLRDWRETTVPDFVDGDMNKISFVFIVKFYHEGQGVQWEKAWCPRHHAYEGMARITETGVVTETGCELKGWQVYVEHNIYQTYCNHREFISKAFCWNLARKAEGGFKVRQFSVELAFPFSRSFMEDKNPQAPRLIRVKSDVSDVYEPENAYVPASLRQRMFPDYVPTSRRTKPKECLAECLVRELEQEAGFYHEAKVDRTGWACSINGYNFRQIRDERAFHNIRKHYEAGYVPKEDFQDKAYFCVERDGRTLCIMVIDGNRITHIDDISRRDVILWASLHIVIHKWREMHELIYDNGFVMEDVRLWAGREFRIVPLPADEWENVSLRELLVIPEEEIKAGYYLQLYRKLYATGLLFTGSKPSADEDEIACLQQQWPFAGRILSAAEAGNPEAQYVMHLLYADGNFNLFHEPDYRRSEQWYKKAVESGWLQQRSRQDDVTL